MFLKRLLLVFFILVSIHQNYAQTTAKISDTKPLYIVGYQKQFSQHYSGWSISYKEIKDTLNVFTIPLEFNFGNRSLKKSSLDKLKLQSLENFSLGFGFNGYEQLVQGFFLNLGLGTNIGAEFSSTLTNNKSRNFLISGSSNLGFLWVPSKELGISIGSSIFGSLSNSKFIRTNWGIQIELGINF